MTALLPVSVNPNPEADNPPRCLSGETMIADLPILTAWTAAVTAAQVPP